MTDYENDVVRLCQALISEQSYSGNEAAAGRVLGSFLESIGFDVSIDKYGNVIGCLDGTLPGPKLLFDGHLDTVPVENEAEWTYPPFAAELHDGRIYGRGSSDMKGALAAMCIAAREFATLKNRQFAGQLYIAGVVHEECFEGVAAREISRCVEPDYVVIGEASELNLKIGQRGRAEIVLESFGRSCHSANPQKGVNAVYNICKAIEALRVIKPPQHEVLGAGILELTDIKSAPYPGASVVPDYCRATYDRRLLTGETKESVLAPIQAALAELEKQSSEAKYNISYAVGEEKCYTGNHISGERFFPGWLYDEKADFVQRVLQSLQAAGINSRVTQYNFCTNGSHYAGEAGIMTLGMGPSREDIAHTVDEYIELSQLTGAVRAYVAIMEALLRAKN